MASRLHGTPSSHWADGRRAALYKVLFLQTGGLEPPFPLRPSCVSCVVGAVGPGVIAVGREWGVIPNCVWRGCF